MELSNSILFAIILALFVVERLDEIRSANNNSRILLAQGGREFGRAHYPVIVIMHAVFFVCLVIEFILRGAQLVPFFVFPLALLVAAQLLRFWVRRTMGNRWTTRVIVVPSETFITDGPFRFVPHPIYIAVSLELFSLPLIFGLYFTCLLFSVLNAMMLLLIRIPCERSAMAWSQQQPFAD
jgi:methyltransferase